MGDRFIYLLQSFLPNAMIVYLGCIFVWEPHLEGEGRSTLKIWNQNFHISRAWTLEQETCLVKGKVESLLQQFFSGQSWSGSHSRSTSVLSFQMVVRVWNELEKEKMMAKLRKAATKSKEVVRCPTLEALPPGWNRINVRKMNGIRAKFYLAPSGLRYQHFEPAFDAQLMYLCTYITRRIALLQHIS